MQLLLSARIETACGSDCPITRLDRFGAGTGVRLRVSHAQPRATKVGAEHAMEAEQA